jgi:hypothetical protein
MNKRLLTAVTAFAFCAFAVPAEARRYDDGDGYGYRHHRYDRSDDDRGYRYDRSYRRYDRDDDDAEPSYRQERRQRRASRRARRQKAHTRPTRKAAMHKASAPLAAAPAPATQAAAPTTQPPPASNRQAGGIDPRGCLKPAARDLLSRIEAQFGPMQIVSTCRPGARIAGTGRISKHATGEAIDFNAGGRKGEVVRWLIANHKSGGTMTYAGMSHVHVDVGYHFVALNSGGRR